MKFEGPAERTPEKDCWWWRTFQRPERKSSSESLESEDDFRLGCWNVSHYHQSFSGLLSSGPSNFIEVSPGFKPFSFVLFAVLFSILISFQLELTWTAFRNNEEWPFPFWNIFFLFGDIWVFGSSPYSIFCDFSSCGTTDDDISF